MSKAEEVNIFVHLIEARGLVSLNDDGSAQPICSIEIGPTTSRIQATSVKSNSLNCVWEQRFSFDNLILNQTEFDHEKISFKIYDRSYFTRNQLIGSYECSLDFIYHCKQHEVYRNWVTLTRPDSPQREWGFLFFSCYVIKKGDPTPYHDILLSAIEEKKFADDLLDIPNVIRKGYLLNTYFYRAQDIALPDDKSNPFVNVRFNGNTVQSGTHYGTRKPLYNTRIQIPYYAPLSSDPIEIQLWNKNFAIPDNFIGSAVFSASAIQLKSLGPLWVNFYSAPYSLTESQIFGGAHDYKEGTTEDLPCMYVGRMLMRLSISPNERNPKLQVIQCDPMVSEPRSTMYRLRLSLYSAAEIPVLGGYLQICVKFGDRVRYSPWVLGKEGKFHWMKQLPSIRVLCPEDPSQVHDVIITLRHKVGMIVDTIGFLRLPAKKLLLGIKGVGVTSKHFVINGDQKLHITDSNKIEPSGPCWRSLRHTNPDDDQKQLIAGFLLFGIALGPERMEPFEFKSTAVDVDEDIIDVSSDVVAARQLLTEDKTKDFPNRFDPPEKYYRVPCRVVVKMYQAVELPSGSEDGSTSSFAVVRFGGKCAVTKTVYNSKCPIWDELLVFDSSYDPNMASPIFVNIYHQETFSRVFLARTEIDLKGIAQNERTSVIKRYALTAGNMEKSKSGSKLLAQFIVFRNVSSIPPQLSMPDIDSFTISIDCIGLRKLTPYGYSAVSEPKMRISAPSFNGKDNVVIFETEGRPVKGQSVDLVKGFKTIVLNDIMLPKGLISAFYITVQLLESGVFGERCIGVAHLPIRQCIDSFLENNSSFTPTPEYTKIMESPDIVDDIDQDDQPDDGVDIEGVTVDMTPDEKASALALKASSGNKVGKKEVDVDDIIMLPFVDVDADSNILVDPDVTNVINIVESDLIDVKKAGRVQLRTEVEEGRDRKFERELELELKPSSYKDIVFYRGKQAGFSVLDKYLTSDLSVQDEAGTLKAYANGCLSAHKRKNIIPSIQNIFSKAYITRVYLYRAINLVPTSNWIGQNLDPYVVIRNGNQSNREGYTHMISTRSNASFDDRYNPGIYTCFELDTKLPDQNNLEITIWSKSLAGDELIGSTTIDIERRLLDSEWSDWNRSHETPREMRDLRNFSSKVSQGKIEVRVEVVERDWAKMHPAENIAPPPGTEYEMRVVLWNTEQIKNGDVKKRSDTVNQTVQLCFNFDGKADIVKTTDISWSTDGDTDWNWRFKLPVKLPCKIPRITFKIWDAGLIKSDLYIAEGSFNCAKLFKELIETKRPRHQLGKQTLHFAHSNYPDEKLGDIHFEASILYKADADAEPVGEAQNEPNRDPYLNPPQRNPAPYQVLSNSLLFLVYLGKMKFLILGLLLICVLAPILLPLILANF